MPAHRFYHADRFRKLKEGQTISLNERQLSVFGNYYWDSITTKHPKDLDQYELREFWLERVKNDNPNFSVRPSRMQVLFAANTVQDAIVFAKKITPVPEHSIPIYEVYADYFCTLDSSWLDYIADEQTMYRYYKEYWYGTISNHIPTQGVRRLPRLEALLTLPVKVGKVVEWVNP